MHRVRYFKIGGRIVWDRTKKLDILTGSDQLNTSSNGMKDNLDSLFLIVYQDVETYIIRFKKYEIELHSYVANFSNQNNVLPMIYVSYSYSLP